MVASILASDVRLSADGRLIKGLRQVATFDGWQPAHGAWQITFTHALTGKDRARAVRLVRDRCGNDTLRLRFAAPAPTWRHRLAACLPWALARHV